MGRRIGAGIVHALGLLALAFGLTALVAQYTWLDSGRVNEAAQELLKTETVSNALETTVVSAFKVSDPAMFGIDDEMLGSAIDQAFQDPAVQASFAQAFEDMHNQIVGGDRRNVLIDTTPLVAAINFQLVTQYPAVTTQGFTGFGPTTVTLPTENIPNIGIADTVSLTRNVLLAVGTLLCALAFALHPLHDRILARTGRTILIIAIINLITFWGIPALFDKVVGGIGFISVASSVLLTLGKGALEPVRFMLGAAVVLMTAGWIGKRIRKEQLSSGRANNRNATPPPPPPGFAQPSYAPAPASPSYAPNPAPPSYAQGTPTNYPAPSTYGSAPPMAPATAPPLGYAEQPGSPGFAPQMVPPPAGFAVGATQNDGPDDPYGEEPFRDTPGAPYNT